MTIRENSDLMNKGLRRYINSSDQSLLWWENSDLMNKGLRQPVNAGCGQILTPERILTWWIKDCDSALINADHGRISARENSDLMNKGLRHEVSWMSVYLRPRRENSDLMNKGLRRAIVIYRPVMDFGERILTWWIKDCDLCSQQIHKPASKGLHLREFWLDE